MLGVAGACQPRTRILTQSRPSPHEAFVARRDPLGVGQAHQVDHTLIGAGAQQILGAVIGGVGDHKHVAAVHELVQRVHKARSEVGPRAPRYSGGWRPSGD